MSELTSDKIKIRVSIGAKNKYENLEENMNLHPLKS